MSSIPVSIVLPIFNGEKYWVECIDSLLKQSFPSGIEIILVDDGSKDSSYSICKKISNQNNNVVAIHQENGGVTSARWEGITMATGQWIAFVDADDTIPTDAKKTILNGK